MNNSALLLCLFITIIYSLHITAAADTKLRVGGSHRHIEEDSTITCPHPVVAEVAYTNGSDESYIACEQSNGIINKVDLSDEDVTKHKNDVANGKVEVVLPAGSKVDANGTIVPPNGKKCSFKTKNKKDIKKKNGFITPWGNRRRLSINGTKTVLMVRVNAADVENSHSEEELSDAVFGTNGRSVNLKSQYDACSNGKLNFVPAIGEGIVDGITTVTLDINATGGSRVAFESNVTTVLNTRFGVSSISDMVDHVMVCMPPGTTGGVFGDDWAAYAYVRSFLASFNDEWCLYISSLMHEIGHNLGFAHSGVPQRSPDDTGYIYEDESGYMGWLNTGTTSPQKCFNGPKLWQTKWFEDRHATWSLETSSEEYSLIGPVDYQNTNEDDVIVLKLDTPSTSTSNDIDYYVMFNRQSGANSGTVYGDKVLVTTAGKNGSSYSQSTLLAKLDEEDSSYTIMNFGSTGIDVFIIVNTIDLSSNPSVASICITTTGDCASTSVSTTQPPPSTTTLPPESMVLVCGSSSGCSEPTQEAALYETHELRCCSDEVGPVEGWKQRSNCPLAISKIDGVCKHNVNFEEAIGLCDGIGGRLCTAAELLADCTKRTGCNHDKDMIWSSTEATTITSSTTPISCEDRDDWYFIKGLNGSTPPRLKDCRWIAKRSGRRCKKLGAIGDEPSVLGYGSDERMKASNACSCACV